VGDLPKHLQYLIDVLSGVKLLVENRQEANANRGDRKHLQHGTPLSVGNRRISIWRSLALGAYVGLTREEARQRLATRRRRLGRIAKL
jgi:hypothetical protein